MWYAHIGDKRYGPMEFEVLRSWVEEGRLQRGDVVWEEGMDDWVRAESVAGLFGSVNGPPAVSMVPVAGAGGTNGQTPNEELTQQARDSLSGRWGLAIGFCLLFVLVQVGISFVPYIGGIIGLIVTGAFNVGWAIFFLTYVRGGQARLGMMFEGFNNFGHALGAYLLMVVFILLWSLLALVPGGILLALLLAGTDEPAVIVPVIILMYVSFLVVVVMASLRYSQTFFLLADDRTMGPLEAIRRSVELMDGRKEKLFGLYMRMFGWSLLCIFTLGIGVLWLYPYMGVSYARFYDDLQAPKAAVEACVGGDPDDEWEPPAETAL